MTLPSGIPGEKTYDQDFDPDFKYFEDWKGLIYDEKEEKKMLHSMRNMKDSQKVFANHLTYLYFTRYYKMVDRMEIVRRKQFLANLNKKTEDPLRFKQKFQAGSLISNVGIVNTSLGVLGIGSVLYCLRFLKG